MGRLEGQIGRLEGQMGRLEGQVNGVEKEMLYLRWMVGITLSISIASLDLMIKLAL
ncbi:MAG: hypothetical protein HQL54_03645 [Magnetococcales bacterium]|nr:hypothetical protein [Magnetococcales bacterium]